MNSPGYFTQVERDVLAVLDAWGFADLYEITRRAGPGYSTDEITAALYNLEAWDWISTDGVYWIVD